MINIFRLDQSTEILDRKFEDNIEFNINIWDYSGRYWWTKSLFFGPVRMHNGAISMLISDAFYKKLHENTI